MPCMSSSIFPSSVPASFGLDIQVDLHQVLSASFGVSAALFSA